MTIIFDISEKLARILKCECDYNNQFSDIKRSLKQIMSNQMEFDEKITRANTALDEVTVAISAEGQQIRDFIAANPAVDTSALDGVVTRLESVNESIGGVFEAAPEPPAEEVPA